MGEIIRNGESYSGFDGEEYLPLAGGIMTGNIILEPPDFATGGCNTPILQWKDSKRSIWAGIRNNNGVFYLWDATNKKSIIVSDLTGTFLNGTASSVSDAGSASRKIQLRWSGDAVVPNNEGSWILMQERVSEQNVIQFGSALALAIKSTNTVVFRDVNGDSAFRNVYADGFTNTSSMRYKENICPMTEERAKQLLKLEIDIYDYKEDVVSDVTRHNRTGIIAEQAAKVFPEAVIYKDVENLGNVPDGIDYTRFIPSMVKMIQIQQDEIDQLKAQNAILSDRLEAIEKRGMTEKMDGTA